MVELLKALLIGLAVLGLLVGLLKWIEKRILARTDSARSFDAFSVQEYRRSAGEGMDVGASAVSPEAGTSMVSEKANDSRTDRDRAEATCPCCGQRVKSDE